MSHLEEEQLENFKALPLLRRMLVFARDQKGLLSLCLLGTLASAGLRVGLPILVKIGVDGAMLGNLGAQAARQSLAQVAGIFMLLLLLGMVVDYLTALGLTLVGQRVVQRMRARVWRQFHRLPISYFDKNAVGRLVTRVTNDTNALAELFTQVLASGAGDFFLFFGILVAMAWLNPQLCGILFLLCPVLAAITIWFKNSSQRVYRELRVLVARINAFFQETVRGIRVVQSFTAEQLMRRRFDELNQESYRYEMNIIHQVAIFRPTYAVAQQVATALVLFFGGRAVMDEELTIGAVVAFLFYLRMLFSPLQEMAEKFNIFQRAVVASERLFKILDAEVEPGHEGQTSGPQPGRIEVKDLHFAYEPDKPVLKGVSLSVEPGQTVALVGPTGSGKTTLAALILGFYPLKGQPGSIEVEGLPLQEWSLPAMRERIGLVQQDLYLFSGDLKKNVVLYRDIDEERYQKALRTSRAETVADRNLGEEGGELSLGERQLLSFARALASDPPLLILDEATASIDSLTEQAIIEAMEQLFAGRTALVIAHRLATIKKADKIVVLNHGQVVEEGTHQQLLENDGLYARMFERQLLGNSRNGDPEVS